MSPSAAAGCETPNKTFLPWLHRGRVELCAIISIRSGPCAMDCAFCGQNRYSGGSRHAPLEGMELLQRIYALAKLPVKHIGLVAAGAALGDRSLQRLGRTLTKLPKEILARLCASLGRLKTDQLAYLRHIGIRRYHHNLETSRDFYPQVCTTQTFEQRANVVQAAISAGLEVCSGTLLGLGESWEQRVALAQTLSSMGVTNIPLNFLHPQRGTELEHRSPLSADEALRTIGLFRQILPHATLRVCGGRVPTFGSRQQEVFAWGANALMTGDYLTTCGQGIEADLAMFAELGLEIDTP